MLGPVEKKGRRKPRGKGPEVSRWREETIPTTAVKGPQSFPLPSQPPPFLSLSLFQLVTGEPCREVCIVPQSEVQLSRPHALRSTSTSVAVPRAPRVSSNINDVDNHGDIDDDNDGQQQRPSTPTPNLINLSKFVGDAMHILRMARKGKVDSVGNTWRKRNGGVRNDIYSNNTVSSKKNVH